jgi:hypothetical protein
MKSTLTILFTVTTILLFGQPNSYVQIEQHILKTDSLLELNSFVTKEYDGMSFCGGTLTGHYQDEKLVLITSWYSYEAGYGTLDAYYMNKRLVGINRHEHYAEWEKYSEKHPTGEGEYGDTYKSMSYTDTTYKVILADKPIMHTLSKDLIIDSQLNENQLSKWLICIESMLLELAGKTDEAIQLLQQK